MEFHILTGISNFEMENFKVIFNLTWNFPFILWNFPDKMEHEKSHFIMKMEHIYIFLSENGVWKFKIWSIKAHIDISYFIYGKIEFSASNYSRLCLAVLDWTFFSLVFARLVKNWGWSSIIWNSDFLKSYLFFGAWCAHES